MFYSLIDYFSSPAWQQFIFIWKVASYIISALLLAGIIYLVARINLLGKAIREAEELINISSIPKRRLVKQWESIKGKFEKSDEANMKLAIIEADKLLDFILERMGYKGASMGEKLSGVTEAQFPRLNDLWRAHKVRNNIVHSPEYKLTRDEVEETLEIFRNILDDLGVI